MSFEWLIKTTWLLFGCSTLVRQRPMKSLTSVCLSIRLSICPSVRPSFRPSVSFLKIESLAFCDIIHDDSWSWYLVNYGARFLKKQKKKFVVQIWTKWNKIRPKPTLYIFGDNLKKIKDNLWNSFDTVHQCFYENYMVLHTGKCHFMCLGNNTENETFLFHNILMENSKEQKNYRCYNWK